MLRSQDIRWIRGNKATFLNKDKSKDEKLAIILKKIHPLIIAELFFVDEMALIDMRILFSKKKNSEVKCIIDDAIKGLKFGDFVRLSGWVKDQQLVNELDVWIDEMGPNTVAQDMLLTRCGCAFGNPLARRSDSRPVTPLVDEVDEVLYVLNFPKDASSSMILKSQNLCTRLVAIRYHNAILSEMRVKKELRLHEEKLKRNAAGRIADDTQKDQTPPVQWTSAFRAVVSGHMLMDSIEKDCTPQPLPPGAELDEEEGEDNPEDSDEIDVIVLD